MNAVANICVLVQRKLSYWHFVSCFFLPVLVSFYIIFFLLTVALLSLLFTLNPFDSFQGRQTTYTFYSVCHSWDIFVCNIRCTMYIYWLYICQSFTSFVTICKHFLWTYRLKRILIHFQAHTFTYFMPFPHVLTEFTELPYTQTIDNMEIKLETKAYVILSGFRYSNIYLLSPSLVYAVYGPTWCAACVIIYAQNTCDRGFFLSVPTYAMVWIFSTKLHHTKVDLSCYSINKWAYCDYKQLRSNCVEPADRNRRKKKKTRNKNHVWNSLHSPGLFILTTRKFRWQSFDDLFGKSINSAMHCNRVKWQLWKNWTSMPNNWNETTHLLP